MSMGVALSICMCALFGTGCSNPDVNNAINGAASYTSTQGEVYNFAIKLVKEQLDAPSTACQPKTWSQGRKIRIWPAEISTLPAGKVASG